VKKIFTPGCFQNGAASLYDVGNAPGLHFMDIVVKHALVSAHDTINLETFVYTGTHYRSYAGIHTRGITAGSKNSYLADFFIHSNRIGNCFSAG
jgi:hypothetical protein